MIVRVFYFCKKVDLKEVKNEGRFKMRNLAMENGTTKEQNTKKATKGLVLSSLLIGIGFVLHAIVPPLFFGIKPDFLLACMFIAVVVNMDAKNALVTGIVAGIVAALTTGFPGGQLPSVLDKITSAMVVYAMYKMIPKNLSPAQNLGIFGIVCFLGTVISGLVFLGSALAIAGLPAPFMALVVGIVLPTAVGNTAFGILMYKVQQRFA